MLLIVFYDFCMTSFNFLDLIILTFFFTFSELLREVVLLLVSIIEKETFLFLLEIEPLL